MRVHTRNLARLVGVVMLISLTPAVALPATPSPFAGLRNLAGTWSCTYRAGAMRMAYDATYAYDRDGHTLRETASWAGGGDEELIGYNAKRHVWTAVVFEDDGGTTVLRATGSDPNHIAYDSVYPDARIAEKIDRVSARAYTIHATVHSGGTTTVSVDSCERRAR